jgi:hypothetical protein
MPTGKMFKQSGVVAISLWALTMLLLLGIPSSWWHYPSDLWLRIVVAIPMLGAIIFMVIAAFKRLLDA